MRVQFVVALILVFVLSAMMNMSATAMAWGVAGVYVLRAMWIQVQIAAAVNIPVSTIFRAVFPGVMVGTVVAGFLWGANSLWVEMSVSSLPRLLLAGLSGLLLAVSVLIFVRKLLPLPIERALAKRSDLPPILRRTLGLN